jgi:hypothetical protein
MQRYRGAPRVSALIAAIVRPHNWSTVAIPSEQVAAATYRRPPVNHSGSPYWPSPIQEGVRRNFAIPYASAGAGGEPAGGSP